MKIKQFRYSSDNLSYLLYDETSAIAIDAGAVEAIIAFIGEQGLKLEFVTNTHLHPDHTLGNKAVLERSGSKYLENNALREKGKIKLGKEEITVYHTPGHTEDSVCFHWGKVLITGDTLFNGTVGNCFSGDIKAFFESAKLLASFPAETVIYAGHDYIKESMFFAKYVDPDNKEIDLFLKKYDPNHVYSTLADEFKINPYLRFNDEKMTAILRKRGLSTKTEYDRWKSLMAFD